MPGSNGGSKLHDRQQELTQEQRDARALAARADNDFAWSSWADADAALSEIDGPLEKLSADELPPRSQIEVLCLATGPLQEVSIDSGWGDEFLNLAVRADAPLAIAYGQPWWRRLFGRLRPT